MARVPMHQMHKGLEPESNRRLTVIIPCNIPAVHGFWASNVPFYKLSCLNCSQLLCTVGMIALRIPQFTLLPFMVVQLCHALR